MWNSEVQAEKSDTFVVPQTKAYNLSVDIVRQGRSHSLYQ